MAETVPDILSVRDLTLTYGGIIGVRDFSIDIPAGGVVALLGPNGSGKSSALKGICGEGTTKGTVLFDGHDVSHWSPNRRARAGLVQVPQEGGLFKEMTALENLSLGAYKRSKQEREAALRRVFDLFPLLAETKKLPAGMLSGGEQQMLAMGRALMGSPKLLLLDEPTIGLAPVAVTEVFRQIASVSQAGLSLVIVDQNAMQALQLATHVCIVNRGRVVYSATKEQALSEVNMVDAHLGLVTTDQLSDDASETDEPTLSDAAMTSLRGRVRARLRRKPRV